jgi:hypothetical protein
MFDPVRTRTLALAQRFRLDAQQTHLPEYSSLMLRAAEELEELVRGEDTTATVHLLQRKAG